jgi:hypothetical protein
LLPPSYFDLVAFHIHQDHNFTTMKTGQTIVELAQELLDQQESKRDFHAKTKSLNMLPTGQFRLETKDEEVLMPATGYAHQGERTKMGYIPIDNNQEG